MTSMDTADEDFITFATSKSVLKPEPLKEAYSTLDKDVHKQLREWIKDYRQRQMEQESKSKDKDSVLHKVGRILETSLPEQSNSTHRLFDPNATSEQQRFMRHGLITTIFQAYSTHQRLILRPDDIWIAILVQFGLYLNRYTDVSASLIKPPDKIKDKIVLSLIANGDTLDTADYGDIAVRMTELIRPHLHDATVMDWLMPKFTTTKPRDSIACAMTIMGGLKPFFKYEARLRCGLPQVTLKGTLQDWIQLRKNVDLMLQSLVPKQHPHIQVHIADPPHLCYLRQWHHLLVPILDELVYSYHGQVNLDFWSKVCHYEAGSGPSALSGWLTAFTYFKSSGEPFLKHNEAEYEQAPLWKSTEKYVAWSVYPTIKSEEITEGFLYAPLKIISPSGKHSWNTGLVAGQFIAKIASDCTALQPRTDWAVYLEDKE